MAKKTFRECESYGGIAGQLRIFCKRDGHTKYESECKECINNENYAIKIQCPDCGSIFILNEFGEYFCKHCNRIYSESEIRERCGL